MLPSAARSSAGSVGNSLVSHVAGNQALGALLEQLESDSCEPSLLGMIQVVLIQDAFEFLL
jgi:hypothetical protein